MAYFGCNKLVVLIQRLTELQFTGELLTNMSIRQHATISIHNFREKQRNYRVQLVFRTMYTKPNMFHLNKVKE